MIVINGRAKNSAELCENRLAVCGRRHAGNGSRRHGKPHLNENPALSKAMKRRFGTLDEVSDYIKIVFDYGRAMADRQDKS